jgi:hypothetical protein
MTARTYRRIYKVEIAKGSNNHATTYGDTEAEAWNKMVDYARGAHQGLADGFLVNASRTYATPSQRRWREYSDGQDLEKEYARLTLEENEAFKLGNPEFFI